MSNLLQKESVYIIIPVYNRKALTLACLDSLSQTGDRQRYQVVVVDDGSTDGTAAAIQVAYPDVGVVSGNGDLWWTGAIAKGMDYAYEQGAEFLVWLNDDCIPEANTLPTLLEFARQNPNTIVAPTCYNQEEQRVDHNGFQGRQSCGGEPGKVTAVDGMCGWCVVIPRAVFSKIGPPDAKKFPQYSGDDTYTLKATRNGFKAYVLGDVKVNLIGPPRQSYDFEAYLKPGQSPIATLKAVYWQKKSPYYIPTKFFFYTEFYGPVLGPLYFLGKMLIWSGQWLKWSFTSGKAAASS